MKIYYSVIALPILIFFVLLSNIHTQTKDSGMSKIIWNDIKVSVDDGVCTYTSPLRFNGYDWIKTGAVILTTAAFMPYDNDIKKEFSKNHTDAKDKIADVGNLYGNLITPVVLVTGFYSYGLFFKDEYVRETGRMIFEAVLYSGIVTDAAKIVVGRARPYTNHNQYFYKMFTLDEGYVSFPSGHSTVAFAVSSVLANRIHNVYASIGLYSISTLTAFSRIYSDKHWASDALIGSAIGYFIGDYVSSDNKKCGSKSKVTYQIYPTISGLGLNVSF